MPSRDIRPINGRIIVTSRGTKQGDIHIPEHLLKNSNVCTTDAGEKVICRDGAGHELDELSKIIKPEDIIAIVHGDAIYPSKGWVLARKCEDPEDESGIIVSPTGNSTQFAEILVVGEKTGLDSAIGWLAYIKPGATEMQKVEETEYDWLINVSCIEMAVEPEE